MASGSRTSSRSTSSRPASLELGNTGNPQSPPPPPPLLPRHHDITTVTLNHAKLIKSHSSSSAHNHLINAYLRCFSIPAAQLLCDKIPQPNVVSWTSLMSGYIAAGDPNHSLLLLTTMTLHQVHPNPFTIATAINSCAQLSHLYTSRAVHALVSTLGFHSEVVFSTTLIDMYGKSNYLNEARQVFD